VGAIPRAEERVLSTLNADGSRRWIRPRPSKGRFYKRRLVTAWSLILFFVALPFGRIHGEPLLLLDVPARRFVFFGKTFLPTDTFLLMLLLFGIFVGIFLVTAVFGRLWCGWACPQTVYMELLFRPLERWIEGGRNRQLELDRTGADGRRMIKYGVFFLLSAFFGNIFLAYFVGTDRLAQWMTSPPTEHPAGFLVMATVTLLMFADFTYFREQVCLVACPYGRFQSVLLDRSSLIVGYDPKRGDPRGKLRRGRGEELGDCIDCLKCVMTCPTGIDIRDGLQMECIHCTQCIDACDAVMDKIGRPRGLIRYTSKHELETGRRRFLRPRLIVYAAILTAIFGVLGYSLASKRSADITVLRGLGAPYTRLASGKISNQIRLKIVNRSGTTRSYAFQLKDAPPGVELIAPENPLVVPAGSTGLTAAFVTAPPEVCATGEYHATLHIDDGIDFEDDVPLRLLGPVDHGKTK